MTVQDVIDKYKNKYKKLNFYYHADIRLNSGEKLIDEFVGVASYHDGQFDTSEDPDGWVPEDEIKNYQIVKIDNDEVAISLSLGDW